MPWSNNNSKPVCSAILRHVWKPVGAVSRAVPSLVQRTSSGEGPLLYIPSHAEGPIVGRITPCAAGDACGAAKCMCLLMSSCAQISTGVLMARCCAWGCRLTPIVPRLSELLGTTVGHRGPCTTTSACNWLDTGQAAQLWRPSIQGQLLCWPASCVQDVVADPRKLHTAGIASERACLCLYLMQ